MHPAHLFLAGPKKLTIEPLWTSFVPAFDLADLDPLRARGLAALAGADSFGAVGLVVEGCFLSSVLTVVAFILPLTFSGAGSSPSTDSYSE